jgi:hypothetical protein
MIVINWRMMTAVTGNDIVVIVLHRASEVDSSDDCRRPSRPYRNIHRERGRFKAPSSECHQAYTAFDRSVPRGRVSFVNKAYKIHIWKTKLYYTFHFFPLFISVDRFTHQHTGHDDAYFVLFKMRKVYIWHPACTLTFLCWAYKLCIKWGS